MPHADVLRYAVAAGLSLILVWAAADDAINRRIPNAAVLAALGLYAAWALIALGHGLGSGLLAGGLAFAIGYGLWMFKVVGAGDAKLFAAVALFMGLADFGAYALATVLAGGVLAVISLASRPTRALVMITLRGRGDFGRGVPYGVAIGFGGALVLWARLMNWLPLLPVRALH